MSQPRDVLDNNQAAERLGVSATTLNNWRCRRFGPPFVKVGRLVKYREADLDHWLKHRTVATESITESSS